VVSQRNNINSRISDLNSGASINTRAACGVLPVRDDEIRTRAHTKILQVLL
jgi:hypothetical protein